MYCRPLGIQSEVHWQHALSPMLFSCPEGKGLPKGTDNKQKGRTGHSGHSGHRRHVRTCVYCRPLGKPTRSRMLTGDSDSDASSARSDVDACRLPMSLRTTVTRAVGRDIFRVKEGLLPSNLHHDYVRACRHLPCGSCFMDVCMQTPVLREHFAICFTEAWCQRMEVGGDRSKHLHT